ncbi:MAG: tetratricopeptide repeat protein [Candidatus Zixiibacteriota bacterium]
MGNKNTLEIAPRWELAAFLVVTLLALLVRINHLSADPPIELTTSQDVYTDPAQYTSFARNYVLFGSFNPLHDYRLVFFLKSATTLLAVAIFKLFGVSYASANTVGLAFSFSTLILLYFIIRKAAGVIAALLFLLFISFDFNQTFFGRLSFLENSMNFFAVASFAVLYLSHKAALLPLAGLLLGAGIFFGKLIGMTYFFPFFCYALYEFYLGYPSETKRIAKKYLLFAAGFAGIAVFWYFFSYRPMASSVTGYVEEQAFDLYGAPTALKSFGDFLYKYVSLGMKSRLFERMPVPALLGWGMIVFILYKLTPLSDLRRKLVSLSPGLIFFFAAALGAYGALMIWNYRPLRYQTMLIYPLYALAAIMVSNLLGRKIKSPSKPNRTVLFWSLFFILSLVALYQLLQQAIGYEKGSFDLTTVPYFFLAIGVGFTFLAYFIVNFTAVSRLLASRPARYILLIALIAGTILPGAIKYLHWSGRATYCIEANSRDINTVLSPEAVISGPYAATLTLGNINSNLIHMFGVANVDTAFFKRYPITHLLLDKSNEEQAKNNYPEIMRQAKQVSFYYIGTFRVTLYRVAGATGNITADQYQLSNYEIAIDSYFRNQYETGHLYMRRHQTQFPRNLSANYASALLAHEFKIYDEAEMFFKEAIAFSPTDFHLRYRLGEFYIAMNRESGRPEFYEKGKKELELVKKYNPISKQVWKNVDDLLAGKSTGEIE